MLNIQLLEEEIKNSGYKISFIAEKLGISEQGLAKKRKGNAPFRKLEILELAKMFNLSNDRINEIFFD